MEVQIMTMTERTWEVNGLIISKTWEVSEATGKKYDCIYMVDEPDGDNIDCFKTLKEAKECAKNY